MSTSSPPPKNETTSTGKTSSTTSSSDPDQDLVNLMLPPDVFEGRTGIVTVLQMERDQYIRAIHSPIPPSSTVVQNAIEKFLQLWDRGMYSITTLTDDQVWYLRMAHRITFEEALELSPSGRNWSSQPNPEMVRWLQTKKPIRIIPSGLSPSTAGTTSTSTPESKEPSSSSTNNALSGLASGRRRSFVYLAEIIGFY